jgi:hypothetical protein
VAGAASWRRPAHPPAPRAWLDATAATAPTRAARRRHLGGEIGRGSGPSAPMALGSARVGHLSRCVNRSCGGRRRGPAGMLHGMRGSLRAAFVRDARCRRRRVTSGAHEQRTPDARPDRAARRPWPCAASRPARVAPWLDGEAFAAVTRTPDETSVVCRAEVVPAGVRAEPGWRALRVAGPLDFALTGVLLSLLAPLGGRGRGRLRALHLRHRLRARAGGGARRRARRARRRRAPDRARRRRAR